MMTKRDLLRDLESAEKEVARLRAEIQFHIDLLESVAEAVKEGVENEEEAERSYNMGKSAAYLTVAKNLRGILDGSKTE